MVKYKKLYWGIYGDFKKIISNINISC